MQKPGKTFRIFVSSTFSDLKEERNALQKHVFPRLRELCMQHGCRFQAIDLRWGVREEAALDQQTMKICLEEIKRCQKTSPRPNFIVLLGDRYGWRPLPYEIPYQEFEHILQKVIDENEKELLQKWYRRDENALPAVYDLQPRTGEFVEWKNWEPVEHKLRTIFLEAIKDLSLEPDQRLKYTASATEQEVVHGALQCKDASEHVFGFFREIMVAQENGSYCPIHGAPLDQSFRDFVDLDQEGNFDSNFHTQLDNLKERLSKLLSGNVHKYKTKWTGNGVRNDHIGSLPDDFDDCMALINDNTSPSTLCIDVWKSLARVILEEIKQLKSVDDLDAEIAEHEKFGRERRGVSGENPQGWFVGRRDILHKISEYVRTTNFRPMAIHGEPGTGKSTLIAEAVEQARKQHPDAVIIQRFIGATPSSSDGRSLLENLCRQIYDEFEFEAIKKQKLAEIIGTDEKAQKLRQEIDEEYAILPDFQRLSMTFPDFLLKIPKNRKLILFIDALDQLSDTDHARNLTWFPFDVPDNVYIVVSTLSGDCLSILKRRLPESNLVELEPMPLKEGDELLKLWLEDAGRTLQDHQWNEISEKFDKCGLPLYLKLAFEEARQWKSYTETPTLSSDTLGVISDLFERLSMDANHGKTMVTHSLGYLAAAKNGLTEDELLDVLSLDEEVMQDFIQRAFHEPPEKRLPPVVWSRLYFDLEPYLTERSADGTHLMAFYHHQLAEGVTNDFLKVEVKRMRHQSLAQYFKSLPLWFDEKGKRTPNLRKLSELPYQETHGGMWEELEQSLCDLHFIEAKFAAGMAYELLADYDRIGAYRARTGPPVITARLHQNRYGIHCPFCLAWKNIKRENIGAMISCPDCSARLKVNPFEIEAEWAETMPQRESDEEKDIVVITISKSLLDFANFVKRQSHLLRDYSHLTFQQAANEVENSSVHQKTIGQHRTSTWLRLLNKSKRVPKDSMTLLGHTQSVNDCKFSPEGSRIISASSDGTLNVWSVSTGKQLLKLSNNGGKVLSCAYSPDGKMIASVSSNKTLFLWDAISGQLLHKILLKELGIKSKFYRVLDFAYYFTSLYIKPIVTICISALMLGAIFGGILNLIYNFNRFNLIDNLLSGILKGGIWGISIFVVASLLSLIFKLLQVIKSHKLAGEKACCDFSPDGKSIAFSILDNTIRIWDWTKKEEPYSLGKHSSMVTDCAFSPNGDSLVSASKDGILKLWDLSINNEPRMIVRPKIVTGPIASPILACSFSPNGLYIAAAGIDGSITICEAANAKVIDILGLSRVWRNGIYQIIPVRRALTDCKFSPDGERLISSCRDGKLTVWNPWCSLNDDEHVRCSSSPEIASFFAHDFSINTCSFSPNGHLIVSASSDNSLKIWSANSFTDDEESLNHQMWVTDLKFSFDGCFIISSSLDKTLKLWDGRSGQHYGTFYGHTDGVLESNFSPDGNMIISASADKSMILWDTTTQKQRIILKGCFRTVKKCAFSSDGMLVASISDDFTLRIWDIMSGDDFFCYFHTGPVLNFAFSHGGNQITSTSADCKIRLWDVNTGELLHTLTGHLQRVVDCSFSPNDRQIISASFDGTLKIWDTVSGLECKTLRGHAGPVSTCSFSPDGSRILSCSNNSLILWDSVSGEILATLAGHTSTVLKCSFSPDGSAILSSSTDRTIRLWDVSTGKEIGICFTGALLPLFAWSPDCSSFAASAKDGQIFLFQIESIT